MRHHQATQPSTTPPSDGCPSTCRGFDRKRWPRHLRHPATAARRAATARDGGATDRDRPRRRRDGRRPALDTPQHPATPRDTATRRDGGATDRDGGATGGDPPATEARQTATRPRHLGDILRHLGDTRDTLTTGTWAPIRGVGGCALTGRLGFDEVLEDDAQHRLCLEGEGLVQPLPPAAAPPSGPTKPASTIGGALARRSTQPTAAAGAWTVAATL